MTTTAVKTTEFKGKVQTLNVIALLLGIVGLILMVVSHNLSSANPVNSIGTMTFLGVLGILLNALAAFAPARIGNPYVTLVGFVGSIALYTIVLGNLINSRILLISALFTWDPDNTLGFRVFYFTVAAAICFVLAIIALIVASFRSDEKKA